MTIDELLKAGFERFPPNAHLHDTFDDGYQLRVRDDKGTRYFINVFRWDETPGCPEGWEIEVAYNDGCLWHAPKQAAMRIRSFAGVNKWTAAEVINWAAELWQRLNPSYYEFYKERD